MTICYKFGKGPRILARFKWSMKSGKKKKKLYFNFSWINYTGWVWEACQVINSSAWNNVYKGLCFSRWNEEKRIKITFQKHCWMLQFAVDSFIDTLCVPQSWIAYKEIDNVMKHKCSYRRRKHILIMFTILVYSQQK